MKQFAVRAALEWGTRYLLSKNIISCRLDAELLLAEALGAERTVLYAHPERQLSQTQKDRYEATIRERGMRRPLAWVLGAKEFFGLDLHVEAGVFCPRPETEIMVEEIIRTFSVSSGAARIPEFKGSGERSSPDRLNTCPLEPPVSLVHHPSASPKRSFYEIGTGTGAISVALACNLHDVSITCCDINPKAVAVARKNLRRHGIGRRVKVVSAGLFEAAGRRLFDCILSNPPYLSRTDYETAEPEVRKEPRRALMAPDRGLFLIRRILREAPRYLKRSGYVFIELGHGQGSAVMAYASECGFTGEIVNDLAGQERVFKGVFRGCYPMNE